MLDKVKEKLGSAAGAVTSAASSAASVAGSLRDRLRARKHAEDKPEAPASAQEGGQAEENGEYKQARRGFAVPRCLFLFQELPCNDSFHTILLFMLSSPAVVLRRV